MTIRVDLGMIIPGVLVFLVGVLVLLACAMAFLIWILVRYDLTGVAVTSVAGLVLVTLGILVMLRGVSIRTLIRMGRRSDWVLPSDRPREAGVSPPTRQP